MILTEKQQLIYSAVTNIDETYVAEALACKKKTIPMPIKRIAAVAAVFVLFLGVYILYSAKQCNQPLSITVYASESSSARITIEADTVAPYSPFSGRTETWRDKELFTIYIRAVGFSEADLESIYTVIEYEGQEIIGDAETEQLSISMAENAFRRTIYLCKLNGWTDDTLVFTVSIYRKEDNADTMLHQQQFTVCRDGSYTVNGASIEPYIEPKYYFMTTEQIIDEVISKESSLDLFIFSDPAHASDYFYRTHEQQIAVLRTRDNAGTIMLKKLRKLNELSDDEFDKNFAVNGLQWGSLTHMLSMDCFLEQLSETEVTELQQMIEDRLN